MTKSQIEDENKDGTQGEIKIDHSKPKTEPKSPDVVPIPHDKPKPVIVPEPEQTSEPIQDTVQDETQLEENEDTAKPSVLVPGGVIAPPSNPSGFFRSKYHGSTSHSAPAVPLQTLPPEKIITGGVPAPLPAPKKSKPKKSNIKPMLIAGGGITALIAILFTYLFAFYIPSQPENAYGRSMDKTGKALETLVEKSANEQFIETVSRGELSGVVESFNGKESINGTISGSYDTDTLKLLLEANSEVTGGNSKQYTMSVISNKKSADQSPELFVKSNDYSFLKTSSLLPRLAGQPNNWIKQSEKATQSSTDTFVFAITGGTALLNTSDMSSTITQPMNVAEVKQLGASLAQPLNEFVFTSDSTKAIFANATFVNEEQLDQTKTYVYSVELNPENFDLYCESMAGALDGSSLLPSGVDATKIETECKTSGKEISETKNIEIWIDTKNSVLHKIRLSDKEKSNKYYEFGQNFAGKNNLNLFSYDSVLGRKANLAVDFKSATIKINIEENLITKDGSKTTLLVLETKPSSNDVPFINPTN